MSLPLPAVRKDIVANLVFAVLLFSLWLVPIVAVGQFASSDFPSYYLAAKHFAAGNKPDLYTVYAPRVLAGGASQKDVPTNDTPYMLVLTAPLAALPAVPAWIVSEALVILALAGGCVASCRLLELSRRGSICLIALVALSGPVFETIKVCKPSPFFFLGLTLSLLSLKRNQEWAAGAWAALGFLKPQAILPFLVISLGSRRIKLVAACVFVWLAWLVITLPLVRIDGYQGYLKMMHGVSLHPELAGVSAMPTLKGQLLRFSLAPATANLIADTAYGAALAALFALGFAFKSKTGWSESAYILSFPAIAWLMPYMHQYDLVSLIPGIAMLVKSLHQGRCTIRLAVLCFCTLLFVQPLYSIIQYQYLIAGNNILNIHFLALSVIASVAVLSCRRLGGLAI